MPIELAPQHKQGLTLARPLLLANCTAELLAIYDRGLLAAVVAPEIGGRRRQRRWLTERPGGLLLEAAAGAFSLTGLRELLRAAGTLPVIGRVPAAEAGGAARAAERLQAEGVAALEIDLLPGDLSRARAALEAVRSVCDLPLLARVPLCEAVPYALAGEAAGADALVVAAPPLGLAVADDPQTPHPVEVHGPLLFPLILLALQQVASQVSLPLIARGGLLTPSDARAFLGGGATAVAADSLALVDPAAVSAIGRALQ